jgi:hypothetical protein
MSSAGEAPGRALAHRMIAVRLTTTATTTAAAAAASPTIVAVLGLVDANSATIELRAVHRRHRGFCICGLGKRDEPEAS